MSELPSGWGSVNLFEICRPRQWKTISTRDLLPSGYVVYGANGEIGFYSEYTHEKPTVMITCRGATCGNIHISKPFSYINGNAMALDDLNESISGLRYVNYFLRSRGFEDVISGSAQPQITGEGLRKVSIPIAPLPEQKRIADKLDTVLARVDACLDRLDRIPAILKRFRQSVLAAATSGKLTEDWRNQLGESMCSVKVTDPYSHTVVAPDSWRKTSFGEVCDLIGGSQPPKSTFVFDESEDVVRLIQIRDYKSDKFKVFIQRKLARRFCNKSEVMIGRYGPPIFQILRGLEGAYNVALMKAEPKIEELELDYLFYWLKGETLLRYVESGSERTAGQDGIRKELLNVYPFFLPPKDEQTEIVRRVEALFAFADRIEARYTAARAQVEKLTPATLAKAFRGELVPQDPNDEPASELLVRIRKLRSEPVLTKPKRNSKINVKIDAR